MSDREFQKFLRENHDVISTGVKIALEEMLKEAAKEFYKLLEGEPLDWLYHTGEKKQEFERLVLKCFGLRETQIAEK